MKRTSADAHRIQAVEPLSGPAGAASALKGASEQAKATAAPSINVPKERSSCRRIERAAFLLCMWSGLRARMAKTRAEMQALCRIFRRWEGEPAEPRQFARQTGRRGTGA